MLQSALRAAGPALDAFVPPLAPLVLLAFLGGAGVLAGTAVAAGISAAARRARLARIFAGIGAAVLLAYAELLFGLSFFSRDRVLSVGEKKYFCEMDCHLAYSIAGVESPAPGRLAVTLRTWFDPSTIAPFRGNAPLSPNPRVVYLVDAAGRRIEPSPPATRAWQEAHPGSTPLDRPLAPGESYTTTFVFEVPERLPSPRLFLGDPPGIERLLLRHENSPGHGKTYFALPANG